MPKYQVVYPNPIQVDGKQKPSRETFESEKTEEIVILHNKGHIEKVKE